MHIAILCYQFCPSVGPLHARIVSKRMRVIIIAIFDDLVGARYTMFNGNPLSKGRQNTSLGKFAIFDKNRRLSRTETVRDRPMVTMEH